MLSSRRSQAGAVGILLIVLFVVAYFLTRTSAATPSPAKLQVYVGTVQVSRGGSSGFADAQTGQTLNEGDTVRTLGQSKAAINFNLSCVPTVLSGCNLPGGLAIDAATGTISAPDRVSQPTTYHFLIDVVDADSNRASRVFSITFAPRPQIQNASLPDAAVGSSYCQSLSAAGGTPGYTWALGSGALPTGVALDSFGHLTGTPTAAGAYTFSVAVTDAAGVTVSATYTVTIS